MSGQERPLPRTAAAPLRSSPFHICSFLASCSSRLAPKQPAPCSISRASSRKQGPSLLSWKQQQQQQQQWIEPIHGPDMFINSLAYGKPVIDAPYTCLSIHWLMENLLSMPLTLI
eukprot:1139419-Pelagomonas_calceolata.AAC.10